MKRKEKKDGFPRQSGLGTDAVILFADLVGSARLSDVLNPQAYDQLVLSFQKVASEALSGTEAADGTLRQMANVDGGVKGDELVLIMTPKEGDREGMLSALRYAIRVAVKLAVEWFAAEENQRRVGVNATPHGVGIGLHCGPVIVRKHPRGSWSKKEQVWRWKNRTKSVPEGFSISFGKRVESASRESASGIAVSSSFLAQCRLFGLPIRVGKVLSSVPAKGFDQHEPIYELQGQDVVDTLDPINPNAKTTFLVIVKPAFLRDPQRFRWLLELAVEHHLVKGDCDKATRLVDEALKVVDDPGLYYRGARAYFRRATSRDSSSNARFLSLAEGYYRAATRHSDFLWAQNDLAATFWKRATIHTGERKDLFQRARAMCTEVIETKPRHFYAYNLRALVNVTEGRDEHRDLIHRDLDVARNLNKRPEYLYLGTQGRYEAAIKLLEENVRGGRIPPDHFWQEGFAVPGFQPPRPKSLLSYWKSKLSGGPGGVE